MSCQYNCLYDGLWRLQICIETGVYSCIFFSSSMQINRTSQLCSSWTITKCFLLPIISFDPHSEFCEEVGQFSVVITVPILKGTWEKGTDLPTKLEDSWAAVKTWPPRHNSRCQRCASVKLLSEEKGSLFNSSSLTPCHCWTGTEPRAGRVVRAALYLVSYTTVLKIRRLC